MKCKACGKEGAYVRTNKQTKEKEIYCRLCDTTTKKEGI